MTDWNYFMLNNATELSKLMEQFVSDFTTFDDKRIEVCGLFADVDHYKNQIRLRLSEDHLIGANRYYEEDIDKEYGDTVRWILKPDSTTLNRYFVGDSISGVESNYLVVIEVVSESKVIRKHGFESEEMTEEVFIKID